MKTVIVTDLSNPILSDPARHDAIVVELDEVQSQLDNEADPERREALLAARKRLRIEYDSLFTFREIRRLRVIDGGRAVRKPFP